MIHAVKTVKRAFSLFKQEKDKKGTTLRRRLLVFFISTAAFIILLFTVLLLAFGIDGNGKGIIESYITGELSHSSAKIKGDFGNLSAQGVKLSERISMQTKLFLDDKGVSISQLKKNPDILTELLSVQMPYAVNTLNNGICSGTFIILDATVNPKLKGAESSKAGVFIKKLQPGDGNIDTKLSYLRGPAEIARNNGIELLGQWQMEFNIENELYFNSTIRAAKENSDLPLSCLYYWTDCIQLDKNSERGMLLCVPLRLDGEVYGICGVEVSDRLFKYKYTPIDSGYTNVFTVIAPITDGRLHAESGMIAGNSFLTGTRMKESLSIEENKTELYYSNSIDIYGGLHNEIKLYPNNSIYSGSRYAVAVMMSNEAITKAVSEKRILLFVIVIILLIISFAISLVISKKYIAPVTNAIESIKQKNYSESRDKSVYAEINDLMDFLSDLDKASAETPAEMNSAPMFNAFLENLKTLSAAEKRVFELYLEGCKAQEIADKLFLSINTIKTHNRRIFTKLNVSSRNELMVYIDMMKEINIIDRA